jgi:hypothetical protein
MPEVLPTYQVNRWYKVRRVGTHEYLEVFAEKYFDSEADAFNYRQHRSVTLGFDRVHGPIPSHENAAVWAVCIEPF